MKIIRYIVLLNLVCGKNMVAIPDTNLDKAYIDNELCILEWKEAQDEDITQYLKNTAKKDATEEKEKEDTQKANEVNTIEDTQTANEVNADDLVQKSYNTQFKERRIDNNLPTVDNSDEYVSEIHKELELELVAYVCSEYLIGKYSPSNWLEKVYNTSLLIEDELVWQTFEKIFPSDLGIQTFRGKQNIFFIRNYDLITFFLTNPDRLEEDTFITIANNPFLIKEALKSPQTLTIYQDALNLLDEDWG